MNEGAFNQTFMTGDDYVEWLGERREAPSGLDEGSGIPGRAMMMRGAVPAGGLDSRRRVRTVLRIPIE